MIELSERSLLLVVSAPSGGGKTTLCDRLLADYSTIEYSVSCTTRSPRPGEENGVDYHFLSVEDFRERQARGDFLEHAEVHGHWYGTLRNTVLNSLLQGKDVLMDIDVEGAAQLRASVQTADDGGLLRRAYVDIFIAPPSLEDLERRLRERGKDDPSVIERRMNRADQEMARWGDYQYLIVNDDLDDSYEALRSILLAEHHRIRD